MAIKVQGQTVIDDNRGLDDISQIGIGTTANPTEAKLLVDVGTATTALFVTGSEGQLFSVTNELTSGSIFSVNDVSGIPSIDVDADGTVLVAPYSTTEKVGIGTTNPQYKLHVVGDVEVTGTLTNNGSSVGGGGGGGTGVAATITVADESSDTTCFPVFSTAATGDVNPKTGSNLTFNSSDGTLTATAFTGSGANLTNVNAATLDSIDSTSFLRSDQLDYVTSGGIAFNDSIRLYLGTGTGNDAELFYNGTNAYFNVAGGDLYITTRGGEYAGDDIIIESADDFEVRLNAGTNIGAGTTAIYATGGGSVKLNHNGSTKFETIGTGATVTGDLYATIFSGIFSGSGASLTSIPNSALTNSSVSYGGVSLALGGSDATPAFNLSDATSYPYTSLTGVSTDIVGDTTPQLGGNLDLNSKDITGTGNINISGVGTFTSLDAVSVTLKDSRYLYFGNSNQGSVLYNGANLEMATSSGDLNLKGSGSVALYEASSKKLETTGAGVTVFGNFETQTLNVSGVSTLTGQVSFGNTVTFGDDDKIIMGAGSDLQIYHDGSHSYVHDDGTGKLRLCSNTTQIRNANDDNTYALFSNSGFEVHRDGSKALETVSTGLTVYGTTETQQLKVSGVSTLTNQLEVRSDDGSQGRVDFYCESGNAHYTRVQAAAHSAYSGIATVTLPATSGTLLLSDGSGANLTSLPVPTTITVADESSDTTCNVLFTTAATGDLGPKSGTNLTFNSSNGTLTATTFSGSGASLTSIPNSALTNSSVSYGGVSLSLGGSDATPAFNLSDATSYPYTSLTGVSTDIVGDTTPQLGGNLDLNSKDITGIGTIDVTGNLSITSTDTGSDAGPFIDLYRNSASPSNNDTLGKIRFYGKNDADPDEKILYSSIYAYAADETDGTEDARLYIDVISAGSDSNRIMLQGGGNTKFMNKNVTLDTGVDLVFEGASSNSNETKITVVDPTGDRTITFPDATGTVLLTDGSAASLTSLTGASEATYGSATVAPVITVDANGRITDIGTATISGGGGGGTGVAATITVADESSDTTCFPIFATGATGDINPKTGSNLTFNSANGTLTASSFAATSFVGVAQSATKVYVDESEDDSVYYNIIFTDETSDEGDKYHGLQVDDGGLRFNPGSNSLAVQNLVGVAQSATKVYVDESEDDDVYYNVIFSDENPDPGDKYHGLQVDDNGLGFNPGANTLYVANVRISNSISNVTNSNTKFGFIGTTGFYVETNDIERLSVLESGNIGIGSTIPTTTLDVGGNANVSGVVTATSFSGSGSGLTGLTGASAATYGSATIAPVITVDANGRITTISTATISGGGGGGGGIDVLTAMLFT